MKKLYWFIFVASSYLIAYQKWKGSNELYVHFEFFLAGRQRIFFIYLFHLHCRSKMKFILTFTNTVHRRSIRTNILDARTLLTNSNITVKRYTILSYRLTRPIRNVRISRNDIVAFS